MEECHATYVLQHVPLILKRVLELLPSKSLNECARVCRDWNGFATEVKKNRRHKVEWFLSDCSDVNTIADKIKVFTEELYSQPQYVILFCTSKLYEQPVRVPSKHSTRHPRTAKCDRIDIGTLVKTLLPSNCTLLAVSADGVVGTAQNTNRISELEDTRALTLLTLPKIEGLDIYSFFVDVHNIHMDENAVFDVSQVSNVPEDKQVKAILMFSNQPYCPPEIGYSLLQHYEGCVIAGGYVDNLILPDQSMTHFEGSLMCIALCGARIHTASVVIREEVNSTEGVDKIIKKLKECNLPEEKSFAFMFACIGRGKAHFRGTENVESSVFKKYFPNTPLFGFFGNGEIGFDHLNRYSASTDSTSCQQKPKKPSPKLYHAYTTILCMISVT